MSGSSLVEEGGARLGATLAERVESTLGRAVEALGGQRREGQIAMAEAVADAFEGGHHLLVQAGTGTGKSLAYLVPALLHRHRVVVATATLALQHQLVERDLPRLTEALKATDGLDVSHAVLKGRSNYACLHRVREGAPNDEGALSLEVEVGPMAKTVLALRGWAEEQVESRGTGDRDDAPRHTDREWRQVSVGSRECLSRAKCPFGEECFAERAKDAAADAHVIVTNHSMLAIDAIEGIPMIPEYDAVVIDEAHELVARVTQAATDELLAAEVERTARRAHRAVSDNEADALEDAADALRLAIQTTPVGRIDELPDRLGEALALVRDGARAALSGIPKEGSAELDAAKTQVRASLQEVFSIATRMVENSANDVLWLTEGGERMPPRLSIAPLQVWAQVRDKLLAENTVVFTSATLKIGGDFTSVARGLGLRPDERLVEQEIAEEAAEPPSAGPAVATQPWVGLDVGSPFDYARQGILYLAGGLPTPGRGGLGEEQLEEIVGLVDAADGRSLGLFSSRAAAQQAAERVRERLPHLTTLLQGDAQLPELAEQFASDPHTVLFGTLSLWQGIDVPGDTCQLVIIDRVPFPRPDDPLMSARADAADKSGGNGFMQVSATHAALLLAQGAGRLIRTVDDKGVVAILDSRLVTARYGSFLKASLPPMWTTTDGAVAREALRRLAAAAG